jgi:hypothetical protein
MGYSVCYVIDVPGRQFNAKCGAWVRASGSDFEELEAERVLWEGDLPEFELSFTAELTGEVCVVWLTERYSRFQHDAEVAKRVHAWERIAFAPFPRARIARLCESLLNEWEAIPNDEWWRRRASADEFWDWLERQQATRELWELLSSPKQPVAEG